MMTYRQGPRSLFDDDPPKFMSREICREVENRIFGMTSGGGNTVVTIDSAWTGNLRWGRNIVFSGGDTQETVIGIERKVRGTRGTSKINVSDSPTLLEAVRRAEALTLFQSLSPDTFVDKPYTVYPHTEPKIWFDSTAALGAEARAREANRLIKPAQEQGFWAAGYLQVSARGAAVRDMEILERYYPYTTAQYSVTVRHPKGIASGWAGVDFNDWNRIDTERLSAIALDKCIRSQNPVAIEPGRYTAILEPQAVCDIWAPIMDGLTLDRYQAEQGNGPFAAGNGNSKIGQRILDERITVSADPMDPDCGFVPFDWDGEPYRAVNWIEHGVLKELAYARFYAISQLGHDRGLPNSHAFRMTGGATPIDEMVASTRRGIFVTRFNNISVENMASMLLNGNTRDGLWLIENGKISKAIKNFRITESPLFILNNVEQLGVPQRVFRPDAPAVCPPIKVRDFNFSGVMDAV